MKNNEREQALKILQTVCTQRTSLSILMAEQPALSPMTKEICFGVCRHYIRLAALADHLLDKRPKHFDVWLVLLIGLYQLQYMSTPDYAVVKETVALLERIKKNWAKGLLNAVLRNFCRQRQDILSSVIAQDDFIYGHPQWLLTRLQQDWPEDWQAICLANDTRAPMTLRVHQQKISRADYMALLQQKGIEASPHVDAPEAIILKTPCDVSELPGFAEGLIAVQDAAAQLAASLLDLQPGLRVLDACCAPGGKTAHILESQPDLAACVAVDVDAKRLERVKENLMRHQVHAHLVHGDAAKPDAWWDGQLFDRILLDAPCSATGVIRRHADIKLIRQDQDIDTVVHTQNTLLHALWPLLAPGGMMLYATCSIMAKENEQQIADFVTMHPDCVVESRALSWGRATGHGRQIIPGEHDMDGFFYSILRRH